MQRSVPSSCLTTITSMAPVSVDGLRVSYADLIDEKMRVREVILTYVYSEWKYNIQKLY